MDPECSIATDGVHQAERKINGDEDELGEEEQIDEILGKVLDEIGVDLNTTLKDTPTGIANNEQAAPRVAEALGATGGGSGAADEDDLQARLDSLKK